MSESEQRKRKTKSPAYFIDGVVRPVEAEYKINQLLLEAFKTPAGHAALNYLKEITLYTVHPAGTDANVLAHTEGGRYLVGLIRKRINDAEKGLPNVSQSTKS